METLRKHRGNAGAMENLENHTTVSPVSHRPLEIAQSRFPHSHRADDESLFRTGRENASQQNSCRSRLRQGINHVFCVSSLWPVLK
jgi:hypothetical protein